MNAREVGATYVDALTSRRYAEAKALLAEGVRFRMLLPGGLEEESSADGAMARFASWFGDADPYECEEAIVRDIGGRVAVTYRLRLRRSGGWEIIQQHQMLDVEEGRVTAIDLLCSGFRPVETRASGRVHRFEAGDLGCADGLAGEFRRRMLEISVGDTLVVSTTDPAAKEDLPPLARMMGHVVRSVEASGDGRLLVTVERGR
jgi:TusA-related sulfurtransferase